MNMNEGRCFDLSAVRMSDEDRALRIMLMREFRGLWKRAKSGNEFLVRYDDPCRTVPGLYIR